MVSELLGNLPAALRAFAPPGRISDRAFWDGVPAGLQDAALRAADALAGYEYPALPATLYMDFSRTGNRTRFEDRYFSRRRSLCAFVVAECFRNDGRLIDRIVDGIDAIAGEAGWQLPAHNAYARDERQFPLPDATRPVLDLFACETGALLATVSAVLAEPLDRVSPAIRKRVDSLLDERILRPYLECHFWWMGNGDEPMCNWTPWCTQNVLAVAGMRGLEDGTLRKIVAKAAYGLDCFLKDYGDDGCCSEGAEYYRHAGLCLMGSVEILEAIAPGSFASLYREEKIRNIARYILDVHVDDRYYVNFADCSPLAGRAGAREYLFGKRTECEALMRFAAKDRMRSEDPAMTDEINLLYRLQDISLAREIMGAGAASRGVPPDEMRDAWYPSVGLFVARSASLCLAVKAGGNGDSHNHNDTGSFILYKGGTPFIIDVGVEAYSAKTFSGDRYDIWTMQSAWHNVPTFGAWMQRDGAEYRARDVVVRDSGGVSSISMELSGAWERASGVRSFAREVSLDKGTGVVTVEDAYEGDEPPVLSLMVAFEPVARGDSIDVGTLGTIAVSRDDGSSPIRIEAIGLSDEKLRGIWGERIWRILIPFAQTLRLELR